MSYTCFGSSSNQRERGPAYAVEELQGVVEDGESILDAIQEEDCCLEDIEDVDMLDVEEGELVEVQNSHIESGTNISKAPNEANTSMISKNRKRRNNKMNKKKKSIPGSSVTDVNRLVLDVCRRLKEKKSYLVYTAVGCLGIAAFCDLVKEVDAIQACGGQKTADGKRFRNGGGILWNILKTREPTAFREIMKKGKEFEKQFNQTSKVEPVMKKVDASHVEPSTAENEVKGSIPGDSQNPQTENEVKGSIPSDSQNLQTENEVKGNLPSYSQNPTLKQKQHEAPKSEEKRASVHERMRVPVTYDDLLGDD